MQLNNINSRRIPSVLVCQRCAHPRLHAAHPSRTPPLAAPAAAPSGWRRSRGEHRRCRGPHRGGGGQRLWRMQSKAAGGRRAWPQGGGVRSGNERRFGSSHVLVKNMFNGVLHVVYSAHELALISRIG